MVIEWLKFRVTPEAREKFIEQDEVVWTATLAKYPGFLRKEVWLDPNVSDEVVFTIRWQSREQWKSVPVDVLKATEEQFAAAMDHSDYEMIETKEYQIRKFSQGEQ